MALTNILIYQSKAQVTQQHALLFHKNKLNTNGCTDQYPTKLTAT
jgi:hypothetical protein